MTAIHGVSRLWCSLCVFFSSRRTQLLSFCFIFIDQTLLLSLFFLWRASPHHNVAGTAARLVCEVVFLKRHFGKVMESCWCGNYDVITSFATLTRWLFHFKKYFYSSNGLPSNRLPTLYLFFRTDCLRVYCHRPVWLIISLLVANGQQAKTVGREVRKQDERKRAAWHLHMKKNINLCFRVAAMTAGDSAVGCCRRLTLTAVYWWGLSHPDAA